MGQNYKCKICGSLSIGRAFENDERILKCSECGVAFPSPDLAGGETGNYYSEAAHYNESTVRDYQIRAFSEGAKKRLKYIRKHIKPYDGKNLLDVGAHAGFFVKEAGISGFNAVGVEPNKHLAEYAKERGIILINSYFEDFKPNKTFNVITIFHVLDHINNPVDILQKAKEILSPHGYIVIEVPNIDSYSAKRDGIFWKFINIEHNFYYSEQSLRKLLNGLGFEIVKIKKWNFELKNSRGIRGMFRTYIHGHESPHDRLQPRAAFKRPKEITQGKGLKKIIKNLLAFFINLIGRGDNIFIIAQKR